MCRVFFLGVCEKPCDFAFVSTVVTSNKLNMEFYSFLFGHSLEELSLGFRTVRNSQA